MNKGFLGFSCILLPSSFRAGRGFPSSILHPLDHEAIDPRFIYLPSPISAPAAEGNSSFYSRWSIGTIRGMIEVSRAFPEFPNLPASRSCWLTLLETASKREPFKSTQILLRGDLSIMSIRDLIP
jgi:hypothetical protein